MSASSLQTKALVTSDVTGVSGLTYGSELGKVCGNITDMVKELIFQEVCLLVFLT